MAGRPEEVDTQSAKYIVEDHDVVERNDCSRFEGILCSMREVSGVTVDHRKSEREQGN